VTVPRCAPSPFDPPAVVTSCRTAIVVPTIAGHDYLLIRYHGGRVVAPPSPRAHRPPRMCESWSSTIKSLGFIVQRLERRFNEGLSSLQTRMEACRYKSLFHARD